MSNCVVCKKEFAAGYHDSAGSVCANCMVDHPQTYIDMVNQTCSQNGWEPQTREISLALIEDFRKDGFGTPEIKE